jgi:hypothetical protein
MPNGEQRVGERHVFSMGEQLLHRLGVSLYELTQRLVIPPDQVVYIIYGALPRFPLRKAFPFARVGEC